MTYQEFKDLLEKTKDFHCKVMELHNIGIDIDQIIFSLESVNEKLWVHILTPEGAEWVNWFLYERGYAFGEEVFEVKKYLKAYDQNKKEICKDVKGLYNMLVTDKYVK